MLVISICFSSITIYNNQIKECDNLVNFDEIIVTKVMLNNNENYEQIRISDKGRLFDRNLEIIVSVDSAGYEKYINFGTLSNDEKKLFDSDAKYIVLSKYYQS